MMPPTSGHLTDDQFTACVMLAPSTESEAHLRECAQCREELVRFGSSLSAFGNAALAWSQSQPQISLRNLVPARPANPWLVPVRWAVAAGVALAIGVPAVLHGNQESGTAPDAAAIAVAVPDDSDAQIAQDNQLIRSVDLAIVSNYSSPFQTSDLQERPRPKFKRVSGLKAQ